MSYFLFFSFRATSRDVGQAKDQSRKKSSAAATRRNLIRLANFATAQASLPLSLQKPTCGFCVSFFYPFFSLKEVFSFIYQFERVFTFLVNTSPIFLFHYKNQFNTARLLHEEKKKKRLLYLSFYTCSKRKKYIFFSFLFDKVIALRKRSGKGSRMRCRKNERQSARIGLASLLIYTVLVGQWHEQLLTVLAQKLTIIFPLLYYYYCTFPLPPPPPLSSDSLHGTNFRSIVAKKKKKQKTRKVDDRPYLLGSCHLGDSAYRRRRRSWR